MSCADASACAVVGDGGTILTSSGRAAYVYDGNGNLLTSSTSGLTTTYGYSAAITPNEVLTLTVPGQLPVYYGYDRNGDTTAITATDLSTNTHLSYDSQARPITITLTDGTLITQTSNTAGQRAAYVVSKAGVSSLSQVFTHRGDELGRVVSVSGGQTYTDTYLYNANGAPLELLRQYAGQALQRYWYAEDGRGNVVALTDLTGTVVDRYYYDVWGRLIGSSEAVPQRLRYDGGYWYDAELGWYWVGVRYYSPSLKRWLQPDPSMQDGVRTYVYVHDDPVDRTDPTGLSDGTSSPSITEGIINLFVVGAGVVLVVAASPEIFAAGAIVVGSVLVVGTVRYVVISASVNSSGLPPCAGSPSNSNPIRGPTQPLGGTTVGLATCNPNAVPIVLLTSEASADAAAALGYTRRVRGAPFNSHGQPVYTNGRDYITPDVDRHRGGVWKKFDRRGRRLGTYDANLNRIAD